MKKQKLTLEELKVKSFVTELGGDEQALGGSTPLLISIVVVSAIGCFPPEAGSGDVRPIEQVPIEQKPIDLQPGIPFENDTLAPGPCNSKAVCYA